MKYPLNQFDKLKAGLNYLKPYLDIETSNMHALHYTVAQQYNDYQTHNWLFSKEGTIKKAHSIDNLEGWEKVIPTKGNFELYPAGCNDTHIETAMKRAIKELKN